MFTRWSSSKSERLIEAWEDIKPLDSANIEDYVYQIFRSSYYSPEGSSEDLDEWRKGNIINDIFESLCTQYLYGKEGAKPFSTLPAFKPYEILRKKEYSYIDTSGSGPATTHVLVLVVGVKKDK